MGWKDTVKPIDASKPSWRDSIQPVKDSPDDVPYAASAAAGYEQSVPFTSQVGAAGKTAMDVLSGAQPISGAMDEYRSERDKLKGDIGKTADANPKMAMLGGLASSAVLPIPAGAKGMAAYGGANALSNSDADLTRGEIGKAIGDTATGAATGAVIGDAADALPSVSKKVGDYLRAKADNLYVGATKIPGITAWNKLKDNAPQVLREYVRPGDTQSQIADKIGKGFDEANSALSESRNAITNAGGGQDTSELIADIRKRADELNGLHATKPVAAKLNAHADQLEEDLASNPTDNPPSVSMTDLGKNKTKYQNDGKAVFSNPHDADLNSELGQIYKNAEERTADTSEPDFKTAFLDARKRSSDLNQLSELSQKKAAVYNQGPAVNLHALAPAALGGVLGGEEGYRHGGIAGALGGAAAGAIIGPRVTSTAAWGADNLAKILSHSPQSLGKFAPMLQEAATRGDGALATTDATLRKKYPEYSQLVDDASNPSEPQNVMIKDPQGNIRSIPANKKTAALIAGGKLVE